MQAWSSIVSRDALVAFIAAALVSLAGIVALTTQGLLGLCVLFGGSFAIGRLLRGSWLVAMVGAIAPFAAQAVTHGLASDWLGTVEGVVVITILLFMPGYLFGEAARPPSDLPERSGIAEAALSPGPAQVGDTWSADQMAIRPGPAALDPEQASRRAKAIVGGLILVVDGLLVLLLLWGLSQITGP